MPPPGPGGFRPRWRATNMKPCNRWAGAGGRAGQAMLAAALALAMPRGAASDVRGEGPPGFELLQPAPGGLPPQPVILGATNLPAFTLRWAGFGGPYQVATAPDLTRGPWQAVGSPTTNTTLTLPAPPSHGFFRVQAPTPYYADADTCMDCHPDKQASWVRTPHAGALAGLQALHQEQNTACLPCHTVGYGFSTGFTNLATTPALAGVQCENCHGPAYRHAQDPYDLTKRPLIELSAKVCGGCHTGDQHPTYTEWSGSLHARVTPDPAASFQDPRNGPAREAACGPCHSGAVRLELVKNLSLPADQQWPLPTGPQAATVSVTCGVCHDPHQNHVYTNVLAGLVTNLVSGVVITNDQVGALYTNQLRYPLASTQDYFFTTSGAFTNQYNPNINLCAQCHNHRGAAWQTTSRPPHHSPQYNFLLGTVGELATGVPPNQPATHAGFEKQCVRCHMPSVPYQSPTQPAVTGHSFQVRDFDTCRDCHPLPEALVQFTTGAISNQIQQIKGLLDQWATTKAPAALRSKYGARAWEYTNPGELSAAGPGPDATEQALLPVNIQKARFDLYLVFHDGSFGVHNGPFALTLLSTARNWVTAELND